MIRKFNSIICCFSHPIHVTDRMRYLDYDIPVLFKADLIFKYFSRKPSKFKYFSSLCEPCNTIIIKKELTLLLHTGTESQKRSLTISERQQFQGLRSLHFQLSTCRHQTEQQTGTTDTQTKQIKGDNPGSILMCSE